MSEVLTQENILQPENLDLAIKLLKKSPNGSKASKKTIENLVSIIKKIHDSKCSKSHKTLIDVLKCFVETRGGDPLSTTVKYVFYGSMVSIFITTLIGVISKNALTEERAHIASMVFGAIAMAFGVWHQQIKPEEPKQAQKLSLQITRGVSQKTKIVNKDLLINTLGAYDTHFNDQIAEYLQTRQPSSVASSSSSSGSILSSSSSSAPSSSISSSSSSAPSSSPSSPVPPVTLSSSSSSSISSSSSSTTPDIDIESMNLDFLNGGKGGGENKPIGEPLEKINKDLTYFAVGIMIMIIITLVCIIFMSREPIMGFTPKSKHKNKNEKIKSHII